MMLSAALDSGLAFGVVVIFFGIVYPGWMSNFKWWGTEVYKQVRAFHSVSRLFQAIADIHARVATGKPVPTKKYQKARLSDQATGDFFSPDLHASHFASTVLH